MFGKLSLTFGLLLSSTAWANPQACLQANLTYSEARGFCMADFGSYSKCSSIKPDAVGVICQAYSKGKNRGSSYCSSDVLDANQQKLCAAIDSRTTSKCDSLDSVGKKFCYAVVKRDDGYCSSAGPLRNACTRIVEGLAAADAIREQALEKVTSLSDLSAKLVAEPEVDDGSGLSAMSGKLVEDTASAGPSLQDRARKHAATMTLDKVLTKSTYKAALHDALAAAYCEENLDFLDSIAAAGTVTGGRLMIPWAESRLLVHKWLTSHKINVSYAVRAYLTDAVEAKTPQVDWSNARHEIFKLIATQTAYNDFLASDTFISLVAQDMI